MPWYRRNSTPIESTVTINVNGYTAPWYQYNLTTKASIGGTGIHFYKIEILSTFTRFWFTYNGIAEYYVIHDNYNVFKEFYTDEEIDTQYFTPLGETILNGVYNMKKNLSQSNFWLDTHTQIRQNTVYTSFFGLVSYNGVIKIAKKSKGTSYNAYGTTIYLNVPIYSQNDYTYTRTATQSNGTKIRVDAQETILYNGTEWVNNFDGVFYFNNVSVPNYVAQWFNENSYLANNSVTIKYKNTTLASLSELYEIKSALLTTSTNKAYLSITDIFDTVSTIEFPFEQKEGLQFQGLSFDGKTISIPPNTENPVEISLAGNITLYEVWQTYRPPTTTFDINTYNYSGETSRVDKTDYLTPISTLSGVLREEASITNFTILIQSDTVPNFNYCYIDKFKRYYYVTDTASVRQNLWELTMQVDALMTYKDSLLKCEGYIDRNEYIQNKMIIDNNRAIMQGADFEEDTITNAVFGEGSFVLSGLGITTRDVTGG